ncbi:MAG: hypothetical protein QJR06_09655 [Alicyclobacillaceae bacterium]|nr:hypothetical protein [Alicyclobacillaceae bacterium]
MVQSRIEEVTREIHDLLEQYYWANPEDRVRILVRRMELQDLLQELRESERQTHQDDSSKKKRIGVKRS